MTASKNKKRSNTHVWVIPTVLILILVLGVGGYYAYSIYDKNKQEDIRQSSLSASISASASASESEALEAMRQAVEIDTFFAGVFIDDIDCSGKTYGQIQTELEKRDAAWRQSFLVNLRYGANTWAVTASDTKLTSDWQNVLDQAWQAVRSIEAGSAEETIRQRYAAMLDLQRNPKRWPVERKFDPNALISRVFALAKTQDIEPLPAVVTGFDRSTNEFIIEDKQPGLKLDGQAAAVAALIYLKGGQFGQTIDFTPQVLNTGIDAQALRSKLGEVSTGLTYTSSSQTANRAHNITLICKKLSTVYLLPGESFSFNGYIGERTEANGFRGAGGIIAGVLEEDVIGGGICQPNTTLCHAVLMADLEIVERWPHSWPSTYTEIGLDATVSWPGKDFEFRNNTEYPIAIVAYYNKPRVVVKIFGRLLEDGATIRLEHKITERSPNTKPDQEQFDPTMAPGTRELVREAHDLIKAVAYKVWVKDGTVIRREEAFRSEYRAFPPLYRYGPAPTPTPTVSPSPTASPTPTGTPTPDPTPDPTPEASPSPTP